jgi:hypothetical protein
MYARLPTGVSGPDVQTLFCEINTLSGTSSATAQTLFGDLMTVMNAGTGTTTMFGDVLTAMNGGSGTTTMYAGLPTGVAGSDLQTLFGEINLISGTNAGAAQTLFSDLTTVMTGGSGTTTMFGDVLTSMNGGSGTTTMFAGLPTGATGPDLQTLFSEISTLSGTNSTTAQTLFADLTTSMNGGSGTTTMFGDVLTTMNGGSGTTTMFAGLPSGVQPSNLQTLFADIGQLPPGSLSPQTLFGDLTTVMNAGTGTTTMFGDVLTTMNGGSGTTTMYAGLPQSLTGPDLGTLFGEINALSSSGTTTGQTLFGDLITVVNAGSGTTTMYGDVMATMNGGLAGNVTMYGGLPTLQDNNGNPVPIVGPSLPTLFGEINTLSASTGTAVQTLFGDLSTVMNASSTGTTTMFGDVLTTMNGSGSGSTTMYAGLPSGLSSPDSQTMFGEINALATDANSAQTLFDDLVVQELAGTAGGTFFADVLTQAQGGAGTNTMYAGLPAGLVGPDPAALQAEVNALVSRFGSGLNSLSQLLSPTLRGGAGYNIMFGEPGALLIAGPGVNSLYAALPPVNDTGIPAKAPTAATTLQGGSGTDAFVFAGGNLGHVYVSKAAGAGTGTLDFTNFPAPITLDISQTSDQTVSTGNLTLTLSDPNGITNVVGTQFADQIHGNGANGVVESTHHLDDRAALVPPPPNGITQVVFLDFDTYTTSGKHMYMQSERDAIQARMAANYAAFNYQFTQTAPASGAYVTVFFNRSSLVNGMAEPGGQSDEIDFRNLHPGGTASVDLNGLLGGPGQPAATSANFIAASATIASHEVGHLSGLSHAAFGPIGLGIHNPPGAGSFLPVYAGPTAGFETTFDIMASPASVGSTLAEAVGNPAFGARDDIKLAFAADGTVVNEQSSAHQSFAAAQPVSLAPLAVPNTLRQGLDAGKTFEVTAVDVTGAIGIDPTTQKAEDDYYSFQGRAGDLMTLEVMSAALPTDRNLGHPIDAVLDVYDSSGNLLGYYSGQAMNDDQFEPPDSMILDLRLPYTGTYYAVVDTFHFAPGDPRDPGSGPAHTDTETGNYELFMYQYDAAFTNEQGHTLIAGSGNEILKGGAGNDTFVVGPGHDTVLGGGGSDTVQASGAARYTLTNARLTGIGTADLSNIQNAVLTGSAAGTTFDLSGWTGTATVVGVGGTNTLIVTRDVNFSFPNGSTLVLSDGTVVTLQNIQNVVLTGGPGNNTFDASGWTGTATFDGQGGLNTVTASRSANFVLTDGSLTISTGGTFQLRNVQNAVLTGGTGTVFDVRGFSGTDVLNVAGGLNPVATPRGVNIAASEGIASLTALGSFTDLGTTVAANYTVSVNWGDGTTSSGSVAASGSTVTPQGAHAYPEEGSDSVTTTISQGSAFSVIITGGAAVADTQLTNATGLTIAPVEGARFSGAVATFTDPGGSEPVSDYTAAIDWGDGSGTDRVGTIVSNGSGQFTVTGSHVYPDEGNHPVRVTLTHDLLPAVAASSGTAQVSDAPLTASSAALAVAQGIALNNQQVATFTDANPSAPLGDFSATIAWGDGTSSAGAITQPGGVGTTFVVSGAHTYGVAGSYTATVTINDVGGQSATTSFAVTVRPSIIVLNPTAGGAITLTGTVTINVAGVVAVDSNAPNALTASGTAQLTAGSIQVVGGVSVSNGATLSPAPVTGAMAVADPLAGLAAPAGGTNQGSVNLTRGSLTINPGVYTQISISGNNTLLTMNPGVYVLKGGGFSVSNSARVSGSGVVLYNAGSNFPSSGGSFGTISLGSSGSVTLTAPTSGTYTGVLIFQSRDNTRTLSLNAGAAVGLSGTVYAPAALLSLSGHSQLQTSAIVSMLSLNGNGGNSLLAAGTAPPPEDIAPLGSAGNLLVYVNDPRGDFSALERARLADALGRLSILLTPSGRTVAEVGNPAMANLFVDTGVTSASGGSADGVLGSYVSGSPVGEITLLLGWNWYAGADPARIGPDQYDFETVFIHELGHALGLGHSPDPNSAMHETLEPGTHRLYLTAHDFNLPDLHASTGTAEADKTNSFPRDPSLLALLAANQARTDVLNPQSEAPVPGWTQAVIAPPLPRSPAASENPEGLSLLAASAIPAARPDSVGPVGRATVDLERPFAVQASADRASRLALDRVLQEYRPAEQSVRRPWGLDLPGGSALRGPDFPGSAASQAKGNEPSPTEGDAVESLVMVAVALAAMQGWPQRRGADKVFAELAQGTLSLSAQDAGT